jgi:protein-L-isoaspartate(D-aspartate) O-methyltransferase
MRTRLAILVGILFLAAILAGALLLVACWPPSAAPATPASPSPNDSTAAAAYAVERERMVESQIAARGVADPRVLAAARLVPRHGFVPSDMVAFAYADRPLPIGYGQTISQPYMVAWMTELLGLKGGERVLEIGTGSGYQAAILAAMGVEVYSVEIVPELYEQATARLAQLGYQVHTRRADGYYGWAEHAPYDAIMVTAAPDHIPPPLVQQLKVGGRLVIPVGPPGMYQTLWLITRREGDQVDMVNQGGVIFVPFTREK